jgi:hypothetical protein
LTCQNVKRRNKKIVEGLPKGAQQVKPENLGDFFKVSYG